MDFAALFDLRSHERSLTREKKKKEKKEKEKEKERKQGSVKDGKIRGYGSKYWVDSFRR